MYIIAGATNVGNVKKVNQDAFAAMRLETCCGEAAFAVLCDGMGGLDSGEMASCSVVSAFKKWAINDLGSWCANGLDEKLLENEWSIIVKECNDKLRRFADNKSIRLGTTAVVILLIGNRCFIMNIGDSRAYEISSAITPITIDHTWENHMVEQGLLSAHEAHADRRRNQLTRCIGPLPDVKPDFFVSDVSERKLYLLCSDGFRHKISPTEIWNMMHIGDSVNAADMRSSIEELIRINMERGEKDNITAIAIAVES